MRLIYFSPVPWASFAQRPHKFVEWFRATRGKEVLWIDPYPTRLPRLADLRTRGRAKNGEVVAPDWLTIVSPRVLPIEPLLGISLFNRLLWNKVIQRVNSFIKDGECQIVIGKPSELALRVIALNPTVFSLYDAMDDFPAFYCGLSHLSMRRREQAVAAKVSQISVSSATLVDKFASYRLKLILALNACAVDSLPPVSLKGRIDKPVIGYVGTISEWFDWSLVFCLAASNPSVCIRLIGPVHSMPPGRLPQNLEMLPACDHGTAMKLMGEFSIGLIPFKLTNLTAAVDPIKYYEYRALGLPVISTSFGQMALRHGDEGVFIVEKNSNLVALTNAAMAFEDKLSEIEEFRAKNSWLKRFTESGLLTAVTQRL
ncbi:glycosyl transferase [Glaciimonas sp. PAMC28666]|uniref:glycosyl transferase n=1 Tax=Glaciimonas sp. PAMC28666 TaxID=2807626 RepID=UPI00196240F6|nr:glycosyl transferase [Glaciimonas sp. PAMC28666]QRX81016.1 glycosyl transferase [Glaciimonas sp. PAMC28666]